MKTSTLTIALFLLFPLFCIPSATAQLFINECMADNGSSIADESGEMEDWIEIYNAGPTAINLAGYYLTDDPADATLWQIPNTDEAVTTVPANGYLILWADKDEGANHLGFKLSSNGEEILLTAPDGITLIHQLAFGPQNEDVSFGLSTDGAAATQFFPAPTPGASNAGVTEQLTFTTTINAAVELVSDDAIQYGVSSGEVIIDHYGMTMCESWSNQTIAVRFDKIFIPKGATIKNAKIQFACKSTSSSDGFSNLNIQSELSAHAEQFQEEDFNISDRPLTDEKINWQPGEWLLSEQAGDQQRTPNLASLVQATIDQTDWQAGNALGFVITGEGNRSAHNFTSGIPPTLQIEVDIPLPDALLQGVYINEVAANGTDFADEHGGYSDWIEIYNDNDFPVSLGGLYLTDDKDELTKWQINSVEPIPAKGYRMIFADDDPALGGFHATFKLSDDGEQLTLVQALDNQLQIVDEFTFEKVPFKASMGRAVDAAPAIILFGVPTPNASNEATLAWLAKPDFSLDHGSFNSDQELILTHDLPDAIIRYTTDGSAPTSNSEIYDSPITVDHTMSVRARAYKVGHIESQIKTRNYLFDATEHLPVLMITTDPDHLWGDETGIYTVGTNGIEVGFCSQGQPANFWQDWERPANLTLFEKSGEEAFSVDAGIKISGNCSRRYALKSLNIYLRSNQYGDKDIDYKLFPNRDFKKYKRLRLRNSGQDYRATMLRDGVNQQMLAEVTDVEYQNYRPTIVYINGEYYGVQNFRDLYGGEYFEGLFDVDEDEIDLVKSPRLSNNVKEGSDTHYHNLYDFIDANDLSETENYEYVKTQFDIENLIDYWASMVYMASSDWPANNVQVWRPQTPDGKWRYTYLDTDATTNLYSFNSTNGYLWDTFSEVLDPNQVGWPFDSKSTLFFRKLMENQEFREEFVQRTCSFMNLIFNEERALGFIDAAAAIVAPEMQRHTARWAFDNPYLVDYEDWASKLVRYKQFFEERPSHYYGFMEDHFDLDDQYVLSFNYDENTNGDVFVNWKEMPVRYQYSGIYYTKLPLRITAVADEGYEFSHWLETGNTNAVIEFVSDIDATLTPIFEATNDNCNPNDPGFADADQDGVCDEEDQCPGFDDSVDTNNNGIIDGCEDCFGDGDDDNDGVCNSLDQCPGFDDNVDTNNNGIIDGCEDCFGDGDDDNDGVCNSLDQCPGFDDSVDVNNNGIIDGCEDCFGDGDDDNDGVCNSLDQCPGFDDSVDINNNGIIDGCEDCFGDGDDDNDGVCNSLDQCPGFDDSVDINNNGIIDGCEDCFGDGDDDNDGVCNSLDQCPGFDDNVDTNNNGIIDGCEDCFGDGDDDNDGVCNSLDQCPGFDDSVDTNNNGIIDGCEDCFGDGDDDNDGVCNSLDQCPGFDDNMDTNNNGIIDGCEDCFGDGDDDNDGVCNSLDQCPGFDDNVDTNNNGIIDGCEDCFGDGDDDNDGVCNSLDQCPGFDDNVDTNNNGIIDGCEDCFGDGDDDNDGVCNSLDQCPGFDDNVDTNNNGIIDGCEDCFGDGDDDNDGVCSSDDCDDQNPNIPATVGTACDDNDATTTQDQIQSDGCTCLGLAGPIEYCESEGEEPWQQHMTNVTFGDINNNSGKDGYEDFTDYSTDAPLEATIQISIQIKYSYTQWDEHINVWIDFNQDGDFYDNNELVFAGINFAGVPKVQPPPLIGSITIPGDASLGATRMRVSMKKEAFADPCEVFTYGEVEDYAVNIIESQGQGPIPNAANSINLKVYPNPTVGALWVETPELEESATLLLYNHLGQIVKQIEMPASPVKTLLQFSLDEEKAGFYFVALKKSSGKMGVKKFVLDQRD